MYKLYHKSPYVNQTNALIDCYQWSTKNLSLIAISEAQKTVGFSTNDMHYTCQTVFRLVKIRTR